MRDAAERTSPSAPQLHAALLDYARVPGKYQLTLRQPAVLFGSIREILQIAAGRGADGAGSAAGELREAAGFFLRAALLYPGADHYAVLGLPPRSEPVELKERYRLLMRLIHPDYAATDAAGWPADAAVRVNRAYEVLSSAAQRRAYDEQLANLRAQRPAESAYDRRPSPAVRRTSGRPVRFDRRFAWSLGILAGAVTILLLMPASEPVQLVQKSAGPAARPRAPQPPLPRKEAEGATLIASGQLPPLQLPRAVAPPPPAAQQPAPAAPVAAVPQPAPVAAVPQAAPVAPPAAPPAPVAVARTPPPVPTLTPMTPAQPARVIQPAPRVAVAPSPAPQPRQEASAPAPAPAPVLAPAPRLQEHPAPVAMPNAASVNPSVAVAAPPARITTAAALPQAVIPTLAEAQPVLTQLLHMLESGSGEQLLRLLDADARKVPSAQALSRNYEQLIRARPVRLMQVEFKSEPREGVLLVTGRIRLHAGEPTIGSHGERFLVRAEFASRGGRVMLTGLSGGPE